MTYNDTGQKVLTLANETIMTPVKKNHTLTGTIVFPLTVGARAFVHTDKGTLTTSVVAAIQHISPMTIGFETMNSHYLVTLKTPLEVGCAG